MLRVGGLTPLSATDFPGRLCAVVFCQGCAWRCGYCHNRHLQPLHSTSLIPWEDVRSFLRRRHGLLDAVVFSGGEPTLQRGLPAAMQEVKALGFGVGLHTAGMAPRRLAAALPFADWVGLDVKAPLDAPFADYDALTGAAGSGRRAKESLERVLASGVGYELRTTVDAGEAGSTIARRVAASLPADTASCHVVQPIRRVQQIRR